MQIIPFSSQDYIQLRDHNKQKVEDFYLTDAYKEWEIGTIETINKYLKLAASRCYNALLSINLDPPSCMYCLDNPNSIILKLINIYTEAGYNVISYSEFISSENYYKMVPIEFGSKNRDSFALVFDITNF